MKKISLVIFAIILFAVFTACSFETTSSTFNGSRTGNDSQFIMNYTVFNSTDSQELHVKAGEIIHGEIVIKGGFLFYEIQNDNNEIIAQNKNISTSEEFDLKVEISGIYKVTVTGERAKGSVKFVVKRTKEI